jgi:hypothetical protein
MSNGIFESLRLRWKGRNLQVRTQELGVYRCMNQKPPLVARSHFELFYKSRVLWTGLQVSTLFALGAWTVRNYVNVVHNLLAK